MSRFGRPPPGGDPDREDDHERGQASERTHELAQRAGHVGASHVAGPALGDADAEAAEPNVAGGDARRRYEVPGDALDLDASRELGPDREPRLAGREGEERQDNGGARRGRDRGDESRLAPAEPPVYVDHGERHEEEWVQLGRDGEPEGDCGEARPAVEERGDAQRRQCDR